MARVYIPPTMKELAAGSEYIDAEGKTVRDLVDAVDQEFPGFKEGVCQGDDIRPDVSVVVNGSVSSLGLLQRVEPDAEVHFLPLIAGG